ncbi:MAG TPA: thiamine pyrophosphate-dependent enzyme [Candidatus Sulfotelmatobacter sp.]|nr:thiamine pyrophosphate-dependent enzyme [Candidatus Sulfotelmatobacter sp.]
MAPRSTANNLNFFLLNGDEAVARGALEAGVKVAASYPGTPATEILETLSEAAKEFDVYVEWSINEIVAMEVAAGASMSGVRSIVSMKHVGLNVAADAAMTLAYTGVEGGLVIAVCDDPGMHSSQNEQDTRYFALHSNIPLFDAGNPQEALDMTREAFDLSEKLKLPIIVRLTTRVAHSKARVRVKQISKRKRAGDFDKKCSKWVMVPQNAIRQHRILKEKFEKASKLVEYSPFNHCENNNKEIGIIGSGIGYYYARSILNANDFSWLKLGFVYPFPAEIVRNFASQVKKLIVVEELRPFVENNLHSFSTEIMGKEELGLEEIGEFTPDVIRNAFASLGFCEKAKPMVKLDLPPRPPTLCPGCAHRAFYYALNTVSQFVDCDPDRCIGCNICEYACSVEKEKTFNPVKSRIRAIRLNPLSNIAVTCRTCKDALCVAACPKDALRQTESGIVKVDEEKCDGCGWCISPCQYGAITLHPETRKAMLCDTCEGAPECVQWCPEGALSYKGKTTDKVVTGDIGCYTLGCLPPVNAVQTCLCMGAGISQAAGMIHAGVKEKVFAVIGDSTFFHAGMPGLLNIVYNKSNVCVIIMDNHVVAMTGHQPTPGSGKNLMGETTKIVSLKDIARSLGIEKVEVVDPYDLKRTTTVLREMLEYSGPSVVIAERPCPLKIERGKVREVLKECNKCGVCVEAYGCPAISLGSERAEIDVTLCYGCGVCEQICPFKAIRSTA